MINVRLTDAPGDFTSVNLDVKKVKVHSNESHPYADWVELNTSAGIYDVLKLNNGTDALIATGEYPSGPVNTVRIELGTENSVVIDGVTHPLKIAAGYGQELKIEMNDRLDEGEECNLLVDFDVQKSIRFDGEEYILSPVIHACNLEESGSIKGKVNPGWTYSVVYAIDGGDTTSVYPNGDGEFLVRGLRPGTYKVITHPRPPYVDATVPNVSVEAQQVKDIGIIELHQ